MKLSSWVILVVLSLAIDPTNCQTALRPAKHLRRTSQQASRFSKPSDELSLSIGSINREDRSLQEECDLTINGNFGLIVGTPRLITFNYQTVIFPGTSTQQVEIDILPNLERQMTAGILPYLFDCPDNTQVPGQLIDGVSVRSDDQLVDLECISPAQSVCPTCPCLTFQGRITVFSSSIATIEDAREAVRPAVYKYLQREERDARQADARIISIFPVEIVNGVVVEVPTVTDPPTGTPTSQPTVSPTQDTRTTPTTISPSSAPTVTMEPTTAPTTNATDGSRVTPLNEGDDDDDGFPWWVWLLIGVGVLILCICLVANFTNFDGSKNPMKKKRNNGKKNSPYGNSNDDDTDPDDYVPPGTAVGDSYVPPGMGVNLDPVVRESAPDNDELGKFTTSDDDYVPPGNYAESEEEEEESFEDEDGDYEEEEENDYEDEETYQQGEYEDGEDEEEYEDDADFEDEGDYEGGDYDGEEYGSEEEGDEIDYEAEDIDGEEEYTSYDEETLEQNPADDEQQVAATWGQSYAVGSKSSF